MQHKRKEFIFIQKSSIELARERAHEQGLETGIEQGTEKTLQKVVINCHSSGMSIQSIANITGLSETEIKSLLDRKV